MSRYRIVRKGSELEITTTLKVAKEPLEVEKPNKEKTVFSGNFKLREDAPKNRAALRICNASGHIYLFCDFEERPGGDQADNAIAQHHVNHVDIKTEERPPEDVRMTSTSVTPRRASRAAEDVRRTSTSIAPPGARSVARDGMII